MGPCGTPRELLFHSEYIVLEFILEPICTFWYLYSKYDFKVCAFLKPGSSSQILKETIKGDIDSLTKNDFLIVFSGANDVYKKNSNNALKNIIKLIKSVKNTNVILVCIPHRFDLADHSVTTKLINLHNSKLLNLQKNFNYVNIIELICNRSLFTKHGLHIKGSGKELLSKQISLCIYSLLGKPSPKQ